MKSKGLTAIELFAGIGGFRLAADKLGIETVWANDLNPVSALVYKDRFGEHAFVEGDIRVLADSIPSHDVLTGGFPCQPFSAAGKKEGIRDPRGTLFEVIVEILKNKQPKYFVLENVKRLLSMEHGAHFATVLSALAELDYFIEWRVLNAKNFGLAQNRERVVITGKRLLSDIEPKEDVLHRINLTTVKELSEKNSQKSIGGLRKITNWNSLSKHGQKFPNWGVAYKGAYFGVSIDGFEDAKPTILLGAVLEKCPPPQYDLTESTIERLQHNEAVNKFFNGVEIVSNQGGGARMGYTIFGTSGLAPTLTASTSRHYERYFINGRYRRLTPIEYARLQGFPDCHCESAKPYDQYTLYGNAVPPPMVSWVLDRLINGSSDRTVCHLDIQEDLFYAEES